MGLGKRGREFSAEFETWGGGGEGRWGWNNLSRGPLGLIKTYSPRCSFALATRCCVSMSVQAVCLSSGIVWLAFFSEPNQNDRSSPSDGIGICRP